MECQLADKVDLPTDGWSEVKPYPRGAKIHRFTIIRLLGRGGCGAVYLAQEEQTPNEGVNRQVALKVLRSEIADQDLRERFKSEIEALAKLSHPNIVEVYTQGNSNVFSESGSDTLDEGVDWFTMRYYPGGDVGQGLNPKKKFGPKRVARILAQVASALDRASSEGILHRDVKPKNILIRDNRGKSDESVVLADFGVAKWIERNTALTATHVPVGTDRYSSPEQIAQKELDGRSDQFSLACTAFELLIGSPLYLSGGNKERKKAIPNISELRREVPREIDTVLRKALSEKPRDRYATCTEFARAFSDAILQAAIKGKGAKNNGRRSKNGEVRTRKPHGRSRLAPEVANQMGALFAVVFVIGCITVALLLKDADPAVKGGAAVQDAVPAPYWKDSTYWSDSPIEVPFTNIPEVFSAELAVDHDGNVYVAANNVVKRMSSDSGGKSTEDTLPFPTVNVAAGLDVDESGVVYVLDAVTKSVYGWKEGYPVANYVVNDMGGIGFFSKAGDAYYQLKSGESGGADALCTMPGFRSIHAEEVMRSTGGSGFCQSFPADIINYTVSRDGRLYALGRNIETGDIQLFVSSRGESGYRVRELPQMPIYDLAVNEEGDLYFTATYSSEIFKLSPDSSLPEVIYSFPEGFTSNGLNSLQKPQPQSIAVGDNGNIYTRVGNRIWRIFEQ